MAAGPPVIGRGTPRLIRLALAALVLDLILIQPNHPGAMTAGALLLFPLELPVLLLGLVALPARHSSTIAIRGLIVALLMAFCALKIADLAMFTSLGRRFNLAADLPLLVAGLRLLAGTIGTAGTIGVVFAGALLLAAMAGVIWWATGQWANLRSRPLVGALAGIGAGLATLVAVAEIGQALGRETLAFDPPGAAFTARVGIEHALLARRTLADLREFRRAASDDTVAADAVLDRGIGGDVLIVFVESYGRCAIADPLYGERVGPLLRRAESRLSEAGLALRSAYLKAPTRGGQSWLSHATLASGLWIDNQPRHAAYLASGRPTLFDIAGRSGFRTAAVMPGITMAWPEGKRIGFDRILAAKDLGYLGAPFGWVPMPDQFTLAAAERALGFGAESTPLFAQIVLISSHAPWVPVPEPLPWDKIGDGTSFDAMARSGDPPSEVWRDAERVRRQYGDAIAYALDVVFDFAARHADDIALMIVLGDHQPAGFVARDERPDVPIHLIGRPDAIARFGEMGWTDGLLPASTAPRLPMSYMRDRLLSALASRGTTTIEAADERGGTGR